MVELNFSNEALISDILKAAIDVEINQIANLANAAAVLKEYINDINWAGFYLYNQSQNELILGPFQGKAAVSRIAVGKGVVGTAFFKNEVIVVDDVSLFAGHIACDPTSQSEIVLPLVKDNGEKIGLLDIDAPKIARFDNQLVNELKKFVAVLINYI
ncbi:MAG: GAF domain-containing protein [Lactobacillaceae bacterium]|jgi:GAF domain-containing protein|nr:GAF domain-containing protein [Lactobacillaceae bacterium]